MPADDMLDPQIESMVLEGAAAIEALPEHASRIAGLLATHFPAQTLAAVHEAMKPSIQAAKGGVNPKVSELVSLAREEAAVAAAQFRLAEMWLRLKAPAVSDGNNFGVDVQNYVLEELVKMRTAVEAMPSGKDYYWTRATGLEKILGEDKSASSQSEDRFEEDESTDGTKKKIEKLTKKSSTSTSSSTPPGYPDYKEYVVCVDVKQYHAVFNQLTDMRHSYLKAHVLFAKNMKKLSDPRGDGEGGRSANVMSMF